MIGVEYLNASNLFSSLALTVGLAMADLGRPEEIGPLFTGFQRYLYGPSA